jgi:hypothetical protein
MFGHRPIVWLLLLALLAAVNLHLPVLQVVAWANMIVDYSRDADLSDAIEMTFDGEHPCPMCKAIQAETVKTDPDRLEAESLVRLILFVEPVASWTHNLTPLDTLTYVPTSLSRLTLQPETPPPRSAIA